MIWRVQKCLPTKATKSFFLDFSEITNDNHHDDIFKFGNAVPAARILSTNWTGSDCGRPSD